MGCRTRAPRRQGAQAWLVLACLLGLRWSSTENRFRRTQPVHRNTPKRADCAGLGAESARAATHSSGPDIQDVEPDADLPAPSPPLLPLPPPLRVYVSAGNRPV